MHRLLRTFHRAMASVGAEYVIAFGTLLGYLRTGSRVPWDDDLDVYVPARALRAPRECTFTKSGVGGCQFSASFGPALAALEAAGLRVEGVSMPLKNNGKPFFKVYGRGKLSLTPTYPFIDVFVDVATRWHPQECGSACWPPVEVQYEGMTVLAPRGPHESLYAMYPLLDPGLLLAMCHDKCMSHCRGWVANCHAPCSDQPCGNAYARYGIHPSFQLANVSVAKPRPVSYGTTETRAASAVTPAVYAWLVGAILLVSLAAIAWVERTGPSSPMQRVAAISTLMYVVTGTAMHASISLFSRLNGDEYGFHPIVVVVLEEFGKLCVMLTLAWAAGARCSCAQAARVARGMALPALCFLYLNYTVFVVLQQHHMGEYRTWRSFDLLFTAVLWTAVFQRRLHALEVAGILLAFVGCVLMNLDSGSQQLGWHSAVAASTALASSVGIVSNEYFFKTEDTPFFVQNAILYCWTTLFGSAFMAYTVPPGHFFRGFDWYLWVYIALGVLCGLCVACVLKYASSIVKCVAGAWLLPFELLVGYAAVDTPLTAYTTTAALVGAVGVFAFRLGTGARQDK